MKTEYATCVARGCGKEFRLRRKAQRFCSTTCKLETWKRHNGMAPKRRRLGGVEALPDRPRC